MPLTMSRGTGHVALRRHRSGVRPWVPSRVAALAVIIVLAGSLAACSPGGDAARQDAAELTVGVTSPPVSLDAAKDAVSLMRTATDQALIHLNPDGSYSPGLASKWRYVGSGNRSFELTLRPDARFSNGTPVTADAVKRWLTYFPTANGPYVENLGKITSIDVIDRRTVRLNLAAPNPIVPFALSEASTWGFVACPEAVAKPASLGTQTCGAGPYRLDRNATVTGDHYTLVPNEHYFDRSKVHWKKIVLKVIKNPSSMLQAIRTGQVDVAMGDSTTSETAASGGVKVVASPMDAAALLFADRGGALAKPLADRRVRQALNYAVDRNAIAQAIFGKGSTPTSQMASADGVDNGLQDYYAFDPAKARRLLAEAGYANGFTLEVLSGDVFGNGGVRFARAVAGYLQKVGVTLKITTAATLSEFVQKIGSAKYPVIHNGFTFARPMWLQYGLFFAPKGAIYNQHGWRDPRMDKMLETGAVSPSARAATIWREMTQRSVTEAYNLPVAAVPFYYYYVSDRVTGVVATRHVSIPYVPAWSPP